jgi:drug/metabolite transporter superfamily protein YnfA
VLSRWALLVAAAVLEVGGDAAIRKGMRGGGIALMTLGAFALGAYGIAVNVLHVDFSRLLGAYVGVFALVSVLTGCLVFQETVARTTWIGLAIILIGSAVVLQGER